MKYEYDYLEFGNPAGIASVLNELAQKLWEPTCMTVLPNGYVAILLRREWQNG